jgi:ureidoacrylate peracid hydrolase
MEKNEEIAITTLRNKAASLVREWNRPVHLFKLDRGRAALILIDMQNFVCSPGDGRLLPGVNEVIRNINMLADHCHGNNIPVIWLRQNFTIDEKGSDAGLYPLFHRKPLSGDICNRSTATEICRELHYDPALDREVLKKRYSAFSRGASNLGETLRLLNRNQLIIAGIAANVCVESTVRDAMQLDYEVILVKNATTTFDEVLLEATFTNVKLFFGDVRDAEEVLEELR